MKLVEQHIILKSNKDWKQIDQLCFLSKNLYNASLYIIKQEYLISGRVLRYNELEKKLKESNQVDYRNLPSSVSQQILMVLDKNIKSYFWFT